MAVNLSELEVEQVIIALWFVIGRLLSYQKRSCCRPTFQPGVAVMSVTLDLCQDLALLWFWIWLVSRVMHS